MTDAAESPIDQVRDVLFRNELRELDVLRAEVTELTALVARLEDLILEQNRRAETVGEVLVEAVATPQETPGELGSALRPEIEMAIGESARVDSVILAEALYPVMGPAMRKMIAALFTLDRSNPGDTFVVDRVLLIERQGGLLLASVHRDAEDADDADIVSGMLDAIRMFVQDAFDASEHDGLSDLRVGDTSVLVEWGPKAVLASVVEGIPTDEYRTSAALTLERIHAGFADELEGFNGDVSAFDGALMPLGELREQGEPPAKRSPLLTAGLAVLALAVLITLIVLLIVWIV